MVFPWKLVKRGDPSKPPVVLWLFSGGVDGDHNGIPDLDERVAEAAPDHTLVRTVASGYGQPAGDLRAALALAGEHSAAPVLCGWSGGCQGVREALYAGVPRTGVVACDGTAAPWPWNPHAREVEAWRTAWKDAEAGGPFLALTCSTQRYTERKPGPYASTSRVVTEVTGWPDPLEAQCVKAPQVDPFFGTYHPAPGALAGYWVGTDCDAQTHIHQVSHVLPWALGVMLSGETAEPFVPRAFRAVSKALTGLVDAVAGAMAGPSFLDRVRAEALSGIRETGHNDGPVQKYFGFAQQGGKWIATPEGATRNGQRTGWAPGWDWCAAALGWCGLRPWRIAVHEVLTDAVAEGRTVDPSTVPEPGWIGLYKRAGEDPRHGGRGHVLVVDAVNAGAGTFLARSPNAGDRWASPTKSLRDPDLICWVRP